MSKLIGFRTRLFKKKPDGTLVPLGFAPRVAKFVIDESLYNPATLGKLAAEFKAYGQLSHLKGVEVAFSSEDRERNPDLVIG